MDKKNKAINEFERDLQNKLTSEEIETLVRLEFRTKINKASLKDQMRRYYLKIKCNDPEHAEQMCVEIGNINETIEDARRCYAILIQYMSGVIIYFGVNKYDC